MDLPLIDTLRFINRGFKRRTAIAKQANATPRDVGRRLALLKRRGLVDVDNGCRWRLTEAGHRVLRDVL